MAPVYNPFPERADSAHAIIIMLYLTNAAVGFGYYLENFLHVRPYHFSMIGVARLVPCAVAAGDDAFHIILVKVLEI